MVSKSEQQPSFWEAREIIYSGAPPSGFVPVKLELEKLGNFFSAFINAPANQCSWVSSPVVVAAHALMAEIHDTSFSCALLSANFLKLLRKSDLQGLSLPQCLRLCQSEIRVLDLEDGLDGKERSPKELLEAFEKKVSEAENQEIMPDVNIFKVFEDVYILNEELEKQKSPAPTKFELMQECLKSREVLVKMNSEDLRITGCENDKLISTAKEILREEFNKNAEEACFADDHGIVIFQDFSLKKNSASSKADLIVKFLNKGKPIMVGMRLKDSLHCVLIVHHDSERQELYAKRWEEKGDGFVSITFADFNKDAIEAYFFHINEGFYHLEGSNGQTNQKYYDSVLFSARESLGFKLHPGNHHGLPELILNSEYEASELEQIKNWEKASGAQAQVGFPNSAQVSTSVDWTQGTARRVVFQKTGEINKVLSSAQQAWKENPPNTFESWGLKITNQIEQMLNPKLTAISFHALMNGTISEVKFHQGSFISSFNCFNPDNSEIRVETKFFKKSSRFFDLEKLALQPKNSIDNEFLIQKREQLQFMEWPNVKNAQGFLCILKFETANEKRLYCGLTRALSDKAEEALLLKFDSLI